MLAIALHVAIGSYSDTVQDSRFRHANTSGNVDNLKLLLVNSNGGTNGQASPNDQSSQADWYCC